MLTKGFNIVHGFGATAPAPPVPVLTIVNSSPLTQATTGTTYSDTITATGGVTPYTWSITSDTPNTGSWLSINSTTGALSGTPGTAETETVVIKVTDHVGTTSSKTFSLVVTSSPPPSISTSSPLTSATVGSAYSTTVAATSGVTPYTWSITSDTPNTGNWLSIGSTTGTLSGTPGTTETETVVIKVTDHVGNTASKTFSLAVASSGGGGGGSAIKWNPGHYGAANLYASLGNQGLAQKQGEIAICRSTTNCLGYQGVFYPNAFLNTGNPNTQGSYNFNWLDQDYVQCLTGSTSWSPGNAMPALNNPIRYGIYTLWANYFTTDPTAWAPMVMLTDSGCGPCPTAADIDTAGGYAVVSGYYGWWVGNYGTQAEVALWRPYVMNTYMIPFFQAMAAHVLPDGHTVANSPYIQTIWPNLETATMSLDVNGSNSDSTYSGSAYSAGWQSLITAVAAANPTTNVCCTANYGPDSNSTPATIINGLVGIPAAEGGPDTLGYSSGQGIGSGLTELTPGQYYYIGSGSGPDLRGKIPYISMVQGTELGYQQSYTPADIFQQANTTLHASEMWWTVMQDNEANYVPGNWYGTAYGSTGSWTASDGGIAAVMANSSLTNGAAYPSDYPT